MTRRARVLHVVPADQARGAQRYARAVVDLLDAGPDQHRLVSLYDADEVVGVDATLGVSGLRPLRRTGLDPRVVARLRRLLTANPPDLVVAHGSEPLKYLALTLRGQVPLVYYRIGIATSDLLASPLRRSWYQVIGAAVDVVAGVSSETLREVEELFSRPLPTVLIPNGRDPDRWHVGDRSIDTGAPLRLLWVGHLVDYKRPDLFLDVVALLQRRGVEVTATIVGDGPMLEGLRTAGHTDVTFLGRRDDVPELMRDHDLLLVTGDNVNEGMPGVFIEGGLSGLPVITTDVAGATTVIDEGVTGHVCPRGDAPAMADRVAALARDRDVATRMGLAARDRCAAGFTLASSAARWQDLVDGMLGHVTPPRADAIVVATATRRDGDTLLVGSLAPDVAPLLLGGLAAALFEALASSSDQDDAVAVVAATLGAADDDVQSALTRLLPELRARRLLAAPP